MSHALQKVNVGNNALVVVKIIDYVVGGEAFTLVELGLTGSLVDVLFISNNVQGQVVSPKLVGGKVKLGAPGASAAWAEIAATTALNFIFAAIVQGTN